MKHITLCCLHNRLNNLDNDRLFVLMNTGSVLVITQISHGNLLKRNTLTGTLTLSTLMTDVKQLHKWQITMYSHGPHLFLYGIANMYPGSNNFRKESLKVPNCPQLSIIVLNIEYALKCSYRWAAWTTEVDVDSWEDVDIFCVSESLCWKWVCNNTAAIRYLLLRVSDMRDTSLGERKQ